MPELLDAVTSDDERSELQGVWDSDTLQGNDGTEVREEARQRYRELAKKSLYFLCKAVLGYTDITKRTHKPYADFIQDLSNRKTLDLMPRGVFKTTIGTIGFGIWYLLNYPDHFILLANQKAGNAERMLLEIESHLDGGNPMMNWLFPEFIKPNARYRPWSSGEMTVPCRTVNSGTPSIMTIGVGGKAESLHFHVIINDDLIGRRAMESSLEMADAIAWHDYSESLFVTPKRGIERVHGTRWSLDDLYNVLLESGKYATFIRQAIDPKTGELFFPEWLDEETLRSIRENNFAHYMSQYMNDPSNPEALDFRSDWLRRYKLLPSKDYGPYCELDGYHYYAKDMDIRLFVDPAASGDVDQRLSEQMKRGRAKKANNALGVVGLHGSGMYFLLDLWVGRAKGDNPELEIAKQMFSMFMKWRGYCSRGYVESYGAQRALITVFNMVCQQQSLRFPMEEIGRGNVKAKTVRIRSYVGPVAQNGNLSVRPIHDMFVHEFGRFPQSDTFDTLDMMAWAVHTLRKPASAVDETMLKKQNKKAKQKLKRLSVAGY